MQIGPRGFFSVIVASLLSCSNAYAACDDNDYFKGFDGCFHRTFPAFFNSCPVRACAANDPVEAPPGKSGRLDITPPANAGQLKHDHLYKVEISTALKPGKSFGTPTSDLLEKTATLTTHTIGLTNTSLVSAAFPSATDNSVLLLLPIYSITGDASSIAFFDNTNPKYHRSYLVSGRDQPNVIAMVSIGTKHSPSSFGNFLYGLLNLITPLTPFLGGFGALIKAEAPAISATQTPYTALLQQLDNSYSKITTRPLLISEAGPTKTTIETDFTVTTIEVTDFYEINKNVKLAVANPDDKTKKDVGAKLNGPSLLQDNPDQGLVSGFEKVFDALSATISKLPSGVTLRQACSQIGRSLQFDRNLSLKDTAYAMAHIVYLGGLSKDGIIECLGSEYGPTAVNLSYWKAVTEGQLPKISSWEFPPDSSGDLKQPTFARYATAYQQFSLDLNAYAGPESKNAPSDEQQKRLLHYFEHEVLIIDTAGVTNVDIPVDQLPSQRGVVSDVSAFMKQLVQKGYHKFGCVTADQVALPGSSNGDAKADAPAPISHGAAFALLAFKENGGAFKAEEALVLRLWIDAPIRPDWTPFNRIELSFEPVTSKAILAANDNKCSLEFNVTTAAQPAAGQSK